MSSALGFDVGTRLIGVAVGNDLTATARPLDVVPVRDRQPDWSQLDRIVQQWSPDALVVGLPLTLDGGNQPITRHARRFAEQLRQRYKLPVHMKDERHSSQEAARRFASARAAGTKRRRDAEKIDAFAAAVILESWLATSSP
ncbi:MAG TPA: Holliday junction resolvase RuvX [Oleiagrimonas sp.]|nr:Holliday junction resolvase RuvX [Oleiagrimonas sp.]